MSETFNGFIMDARDQSIVSIMEKIRKLVMVRFIARREFGLRKFKGQLGPKIWTKIEDNKELMKGYTVLTNGHDVYEVCRGVDAYVVYLFCRTESI